MLKQVIMMDWERCRAKLKTFNHSIRRPSFVNAVTVSMPRTFLLGNGDLALISSGGKRRKEYLIGKNDFWSCGDLKTNSVMKFNPKRVTPLTVGSIVIDGLTSHEFREEIDITTGVLTDFYDGVKIQCQCASNDNIVIFTLESDSGKELTFQIKAKSDVSEYPANVFSTDGKYFVERSSANFAKDDDNSWTSIVSMAASSSSQNFAFCSQNDHSVSYKISLSPGEKVTVCVALGGGGKTLDCNDHYLTEKPSAQAEKLLEKADTEQKIADLIHQTNAWWREYWSRSYVELSDFEMEKYYYTSLYLMACCSRPDKLAPGIFGNFITTDNPKWNGDYHLNYNYIAPFYGMYAANRADFARSLADPMIDYIPQGKTRAKNDLRLVCKAYIDGGVVNNITFKGRSDLTDGIDDAILYPVALGPFGVHTWSENGGYLSQMNDAAFTAMGVTAYYFYTLDWDYLNHIREFLELNVNFFLKWREKETFKDGSYRYNIWSGAHEETFEMNSAGVIASIKNILECLLDGVNRGYIDADQESVDLWSDFYHHLPEPAIKHFSRRKKFGFKKAEANIIALGEKGVIYTDNSATVPLEFIHPGECMTFYSDEKIKQALRNLIDMDKTLNHDIFRQINNLPKIFIHAVRCGYDVQKVYREFKRLYKRDFMVNYSVKDYNNTHGIEKAGGIEFINCMLLTSDMETVKVIPNWLQDRDALFENMRARGAFLVSSKYCAESRAVEYIKIKSLVQNRIGIVLPFANASITDEKGCAVVFEKQTLPNGETAAAFDAEIGVTYSITK